MKRCKCGGQIIERRIRNATSSQRPHGYSYRVYGLCYKWENGRYIGCGAVRQGPLERRGVAA